ncbi:MULTISPECIES: copper homeostasis protein CutC [Burkholderia]|uniref:copper homeostasis protein CutC n=1 Tax=Burkholderia TaxID=32008 RepID=UPI00075460AE|nr:MULTISPECIES: copper homeostasis protein CutC [Burkholderia]AOJ70181.1 copper homeostasis protein CutC [Burkholderia savannae]KVG42729.1 copper homeostasis protein CutC [Burkholderia sp. MSMB0265]KVG78383.1 copper homeostasis protein CutC [Burkholderia sp. MSMB2040]KVG90835.1 copper homeostasis protein CutC [Burkholderia sp. MSMB2041]KVG91561.1 copper homeostasis protein CutC [Burkholderia sp. MSMB2042]
MPASSILLEVIATTIGDAKAAARAGADRLELVTAISEGGLTPSVGVIEAVVAAVPIPVNVIVRPHSRSFHYDASELAAIARDVRAAVAAGANGVVFGMLDAHGDVDLAALQRVADAADGRDLTFHRAFDVARDLNTALDTLLRVPSVTSVLTSGGHASVLDARDVVARMVRRAEGSTCAVLAGAGLTVDAVGDFVRATGVRAVHFGSGVRERGEVLAPIDERLVAKARATLDAAARG